MTRNVIAPLASAIVILASLPAMAATHGGHGHGPGTHSQAAQHAVVPSQAAGAAQSAVKGQSPTPHSQASHTTGPTSASTARSAGTSHRAQHAPGQPSGIKTAVAEIRTLRSKIQTARMHYVAAVQTYLHALSTGLASGQSGTAATALSQLRTINTTLAQTVKTERAANAASSTAGSAGTTTRSSTTVTTSSASAPRNTPSGLAAVVTKFQAELSALKAATTQVQSLTS